MATWKKIIVSGSDAELNNLDVLKASGSFSGSFQGEVLGTMASSSVATLAQTASVALRANALAPTVTATSASTAILAQTASVAIRANTLAPTATATSASTAVLAQTASVAVRATTLSADATASFADLASDARTATSASIATTAGTASVALRANALAPTVTATSASVAARATTLSPAATASFADSATSSSFSLTGHGVFSGSFSGSLIQGTSGSFSDLTTTVITETSAERFKTNIQSLETQIDKINALNPVTFDWIDNGNEDIGLIAEQVNEVYPEFVSMNPDGEIQGIKYSKLTAVLIKSIQELKQEVEILKKKIDG